MKRYLAGCLLLALSGAAPAVRAKDSFPRLSAVEPEAGKVGDVASAKGENLDKTKVGELYLTDGKNDVKTAITAQSDTEIKFKVPVIKAGRYRLLVVTANKTSMIEQPVVFTVE